MPASNQKTIARVWIFHEKLITPSMGSKFAITKAARVIKEMFISIFIYHLCQFCDIILPMNDDNQDDSVYDIDKAHEAIYGHKPGEHEEIDTAPAAGQG